MGKWVVGVMVLFEPVSSLSEGLFAPSVLVMVS